MCHFDRSIANTSFTSEIRNADPPNIVCFEQFVIHEAPGQELEVELYDEDTDADDFLGRWGMSIILPFM